VCSSDLIGAAAIVVILAVTVALFFNPLYVGIEQDRAQADAWTGYTAEQVHAVYPVHASAWARSCSMPT